MSHPPAWPADFDPNTRNGSRSFVYKSMRVTRDRGMVARDQRTYVSQYLAQLSQVAIVSTELEQQEREGTAQRWSSNVTFVFVEHRNDLVGEHLRIIRDIIRPMWRCAGHHFNFSRAISTNRVPSCSINSCRRISRVDASG